MASDHSGECAGGATVTSRTILEPVAFSTPTGPFLASGHGSASPRTKPSLSISAQGNSIPLETTPTAPSSLSTTPPPHRSPPHSVAGSISASLLNAAPSQSSSGAESNHEAGYPPRDGGASRRPALCRVIADGRRGGSAVSVWSSMLDHSYTTHEPTTTPSDTKSNQTTASDLSTGCSCSSVEEGDGDRGSPSPPSPIRRRRGRPPKNAAGTVKAEGGSLPPRKRLGIKGRRGRGCLLCPSCTREDCGVCRFCRDKPKFGGPGIKKQRCAERVCTNVSVGQERLQRVTSPAVRYEDLESSTPRKSVAEILQFYDEDEARTLLVFPAEVILQQPQPAGEHEPHLPTPAKQFTEMQGSGKATSGEAMNSLSIIKQPVATKPLQITRPHAVETLVETDNPSKSSDVENGVASKKQQSEMKAPAEVRAPTEDSVPIERLSLDLSHGKESMDDTGGKDTPKIAGDKDSPSQAKRERSKSGLSQVAEKVKTLANCTKQGRRTRGFFGDFNMKCLVCGRQRKLSVARCEKFCSRRCIQQWSEAHPGEDPEGSASEEDQVTGISPVTRPPKKPTNSRELKNLQIDMALPGKGSPLAVLHRCSPSHNPLSPVLGPSPRPLSSPSISICKITLSAKRTDGGDTGHTNSGTKRASASQPEAKKKPREDYYHHGNTTATTTKEADLSDFTHPTTTMVLPISAPLLTRTVPPPPVSIMHMSQIPSLVSALSNLTEPRSHSRVLSSNIRNWTLEQVVQYFESIQDCWDYLEVFREHELDGSALLLLTHESLVKCLGIKLGHALKIMHHVEELRRFYDTSS